MTKGIILDHGRFCPAHIRSYALGGLQLVVGRVFNTRHPVRYVVLLVIRQKAPHFDAVHHFYTRLISIPAMIGAEQPRNALIPYIIRIPQQFLTHRRIEAQLKHVTNLSRQIGLGAVPYTVMGDRYGTRLTYHGHLPDKILVTGNI